MARPGWGDSTTLRNRLKNARTAFRLGFSIDDLDSMMDRATNGEPSHAGVSVSEESALNISAVYCAVNIIAGTIASLPLQLYRRTATGKEPYHDHPLYELLHYQPNPEMTSYVFREILQSHLLLRGNAYAEIIPDRLGRPAQLWPWNPTAVKVRRDAEDNRIYYEIWDGAGKPRRVPAELMLHIPGLGFDGRIGYSVLAKARETFGLGLAMEEFQARFYGQGTNVGSVLEHPGRIGDKAHERLKKDILEKRAGLSQAHKTMILEEGMKFVKTGMPLEDAQFLESRVFQISEIARWFNLPPHKIKELSKATYSNIEQQQIEFVMDSIRPWAVRWEQHIAWKLLREEERRTLFAEFNLDGMLRGDTMSRMQAYSLMRNVGAINADEIRALENLNPIGGNAGTVYWKPLNMGDANAEEVAPEQDSEGMRVVK